MFNREYGYGRITIDGMIEEIKDLGMREIPKNELTIDIIDVLKNLKYAEITEREHLDIEDGTDDLFYYDIMDYCEILYEREELEIISENNTYNWCSPLNHNIDYKIFKDNYEGDYLVAFKVHRRGDIRCNYTDWAFCQFDYEEQFYEYLSEVRKYVEVKLNNKNYYVEVNPLDDDVTLEEFDDNGNYDDIWGVEKGEILNKMEELELITW